jgi:hypothetical protein
MEPAWSSLLHCSAYGLPGCAASGCEHGAKASLLAAAYAFFIMFSFWPHTAGQISYWADCFAEALIPAE